jgi:hypothetical protein
VRSTNGVGGAVVLGVDPGKASGVCVVSWSGDPGDAPVLVSSREVQPEEYADEVRHGLSLRPDSGSFVVACERFTITAQTVRNSQAPYSLEQIGVLKHLCREAGHPVGGIVFQAPVDAKRMFPNDVLRGLGIWHRGGEGHANDAIRHALLSLVKSRWVPRAGD